MAAEPSRPRILPPVWAGIVSLAMLAIARASERADLLQVGHVAAHRLELAAYAVFVVGVAISVSAAARFASAGTTIEPGGEPTVLLERGPYRFSRNPIYLGMAVTLVAWGLWLGALLTLTGPIAFILLMRNFVIPGEEQVLRRQFGAEYERYRARVRRWI